MSQSQLRIGVTDSFQSKQKFENYLRWIQSADPMVETVALSYRLRNEAALDELDALLLTGGGDVHPRFYDTEQRLAETDGVDEERDLFEFGLIERALEANLPMLGICRGMQVMNVYLGGSLIIDLPSAGYNHHERDGEAARWHDLQVLRGSLLEEVCGTELINVNSSHHQAVGTLGRGLMASAVSPDGVIEAAEWIMKDRMPFLMLIQWHPERMNESNNPASENIARRFLKQVRQSTLTKKPTHHLKKDGVQTMAKKTKYVYFFGGKRAEGTAEMKALLGGKGANLAEMVNIGLPVPPGFTITTEVCTYYYDHGKSYPKTLEKEVRAAMAKVEKQMGAKFGDVNNPLLVSVRSGARASMPGMMDTILNLGLNDKTIEGLIKKTNNERFVYDSYRRFVQMYGDVVLGLKPVHKDDIDPFEAIIEQKKKEKGVHYDTELMAEDLKDLVLRFKAAVKEKTGKDFPDDPWQQLWGAIGAVFGSWMNERAIAYRKMYDIPAWWGTAVNVQTMVFGNMGEDSGTGVAFTRDPATGENVFYGEYLMNAQGEDVVAGIRTPLPIANLKEQDQKLYGQLEKIRKILEKHYRDVMDIEFTIQQGKLFMLQCRVGKRTAFAAIKIAADMVQEKLITDKEALLRIEPDALNQLLRPVFDVKEKDQAIKSGKLLAKGLNAGPGAATGRVVFNAHDAEEWVKRGEHVILTRIETSPEDIKGMDAAEGILTARGGMTSHAALVARQMGKVCVAGCSELDINYSTHTMRVNGQVINEGDWVSLDGTTGQVLLGKVNTKPSEVLQVLIEKTLDPNDAPVYQTFAKVMQWADKYRELKIRTNADQPDQSANAVAFGAEGIGLCRTEHMFFGEGKIGPMREMILADTVEQRKAALAKLLPLQRNDFVGIFEVMSGLPVTIRTIDPPLHEFLPHEEPAQRQLAKQMGISYEKVKQRVESLHEFNPMLGFRGCRLGVIYPEITEMQSRAIFEAAAEVKKRGMTVEPEVMIPLVGNIKELEHQAAIVKQVADAVMKEQGVKFPYLVGTMIEIPRGAVTADEIAQVAQFFSFGTNDLTQTTLGVSRDDAGRFLIPYVEKEIYPKDPFEVLDRTGVGSIMKIAVEKGRSTNPKIKLGICGEHGGDPSSIEFCHLLGLNYVSCSPFRVPIARLAAARAALLNTEKKTAPKASRKKKASRKR